MAYGKAETVFPVKRRAFARFRTVAACVPSCSRLDPELASGWTPEASGLNHRPFVHASCDHALFVSLRAEK